MADSTLLRLKRLRTLLLFSSTALVFVTVFRIFRVAYVASSPLAGVPGSGYESRVWKTTTSSSSSSLRSYLPSASSSIISTGVGAYGVGAGSSSNQQMTIDPSSSRPFLAIVSCIKSSETYLSPSPANFIERTFLPSVYATISPEERKQFRIEILLGYDHDDAYWSLSGHRNLVPRDLWGVPIEYNETDANNKQQKQKQPPPIPINYVSIHKDPNGTRPHRIPFNELTRAAFDYGATYIVRINDDSEFVSPKWITAATSSLSQLVPPNVGVVGPTCRENTRILTHDCVHAPSHYAIFDTYYPGVFDNYYVDDWISQVYGEERTKTLERWEIKHHLHTFSTRYEPTFEHDQLLNATLKEGKEKVGRFLKGLNGRHVNEEEEKAREDKWRVLGTEVIEMVDGPMREVHWKFGRGGGGLPFMRQP
mmetsp:Transcript_8625/g.14999  ORF Transcript_8625/g.14999 Transcript_8625/m.14999 type:complete len:422 (+) Transcript_8625:77-1342(+)